MTLFSGPSLKVVGTMSVGFDHIDIAACKKRGIAVGHTPNVLTDAVAELTMALLLATARRLHEGETEIKLFCQTLPKGKRRTGLSTDDGVSSPWCISFIVHV